MAATPQMLQSLGRVARAPGPRGQVAAGQILAIPLSSSNGPSPANKNTTVQLPVVPVVLSTPQRLNQQQQQGKNFISPILDHSGSRKRQDPDHEHGSERLVSSDYKRNDLDFLSAIFMIARDAR